MTAPAASASDTVCWSSEIMWRRRPTRFRRFPFFMGFGIISNSAQVQLYILCTIFFSFQWVIIVVGEFTPNFSELHQFSDSNLALLSWLSTCWPWVVVVPQHPEKSLQRLSNYLWVLFLLWKRKALINVLVSCAVRPLGCASIWTVCFPTSSAGKE